MLYKVLFKHLMSSYSYLLLFVLIDGEEEGVDELLAQLFATPQALPHQAIPFLLANLSTMDKK